MNEVDAISRGRELFRQRRWAEAFGVLAGADEVRPLDAEDLDRLATAAYLVGRVDESEACRTTSSCSVRERCAFGGSPTHDDLHLVMVNWPTAQFAAVRDDIDRSVSRALGMAPDFAARVRAGRREDNWHGTAGVPGYFREPFGKAGRWSATRATTATRSPRRE